MAKILYIVSSAYHCTDGDVLYCTEPSIETNVKLAVERVCKFIEGDLETDINREAVRTLAVGGRADLGEADVVRSQSGEYIVRRDTETWAYLITKMEA